MGGSLPRFHNWVACFPWTHSYTRGGRPVLEGFLSRHVAYTPYFAHNHRSFYGYGRQDPWYVSELNF